MGKAPAQSRSPTVPGWVGLRVPQNPSDLVDYVRKKLDAFRDFPKSPGYMRVAHHHPGKLMSVTLLEPSPRMVKVQIQLAQAAVDNGHRWLDHHEAKGKPDWPTPFQDLPTAERALSGLFRFVRHLAKAIDNKRRPKGRKRGGQVRYDRKADQRVSDAWKTGRYKSVKALACALRMTYRDAKKSLDRDRHYRKKRRKGLAE